MTHDTYKYRFDESVPAQELEGTFMLAMLAVESLHGRSRVRMESRFNLDKARRTCVIDASTDVGSDLARIFTGFATKEYGERSVLIERTQPSSSPGRGKAARSAALSSRTDAIFAANANRVVTIDDSLVAGNCRSGSESFAQAHGIDPAQGATIAQLAPLLARTGSGELLAAMLAACAR